MEQALEANASWEELSGVRAISKSIGWSTKLAVHEYGEGRLCVSCQMQTTISVCVHRAFNSIESEWRLARRGRRNGQF